METVHGAFPWPLTHQTQLYWDQNLWSQAFSKEKMWKQGATRVGDWKSNLGQESTYQRPKKGLGYSHCKAWHQRILWSVPTNQHTGSVKEKAAAQLHTWLGERGVYNPEDKRRGPCYFPTLTPVAWEQRLLEVTMLITSVRMATITPVRWYYLTPDRKRTFDISLCLIFL